MNYKRTLLSVYGLPGDSADAQIEQAMATAREAAVNVQRQSESTATAQNAAVREAEEEAQKFRSAAVNALVDNAIYAAKINFADIVKTREAFALNFDAAALMLKDKPAMLNTVSLNLRPRDGAVDYSSPERRALAFNARLDELMHPAEKGGKGYDMKQALNFMRANPDDAHLMRMMGDNAVAV